MTYVWSQHARRSTLAGREYLNFDLELSEDEGEFVARVLDSPAGEASSTFELPFTDEGLENFVLKVGRTRSGVRRFGSPQMEMARSFGSALYAAAMTGEVETTFRRAIDAASRDGRGLRVRLRIAGGGRLQSVPWEYMYSNGLSRFIVLSAETPLVRYVDLPNRPVPLPVDGPLEILLVVSSPVDVEPLDSLREVELLREATADLIAEGSIRVDLLEVATLQALRSRLRKGNYHVLHFIGHGGFDERADDGLLVFEDSNERAHPVSGHDLGMMLHDHNSLRLLVLNACEGSRTSPADPFAGVAQALVRQGIPAVVGMQFEITDGAAISFSHELYAALVDGYPVDAATAEARKAIFAAGNDVEWGTPVLHMRAADGVIFDTSSMTRRPPEEQAAERVEDREEPRTVVPDPPAGPGLPGATPPPTDHPIDPRRPWITLHSPDETPSDGEPAAEEDAPLTVHSVEEEVPVPDEGAATVGRADAETTGVEIPRGVAQARRAAVTGEPSPADVAPAAGEPAAPGGEAAPVEVEATGTSRPAGGTPGVTGSEAPTVGQDGDEGTSVLDLVGRVPPVPAPDAPTVGGRRKPSAALIAVGVVVFSVIGLIVSPGGDGEEQGGTTPPSVTVEPSSTVSSPDETTATTAEDPVEPDVVDPGGTLIASVVDQPPDIDGEVFDDWRTGWTAFAEVPVFGEGDVVGEVRLAWDDSALYLGALVEDGQIDAPHAGNPDQLWRGDSVSFEWGTPGGEGPARAGDLHVMIGPVPAGDGGCDVVNAVNVGDGAAIRAGEPDGRIEAVCARVDAGYVVEAAVPWAVLGVDGPGAGDEFLMNANVSDATSGGDLRVMVSTNPDRHQPDRATWQILRLE